MRDTLFMGLHGGLQVFPYVEDCEEDAYSLMAKRSTALGWTRFDGTEGHRWDQLEADGDWNALGVAERIWLQAYVSESERLPILPVALAMNDVLNHVGEFDFKGMHAVVPVRDFDHEESLFDEAYWLGMRPDKSRAEVQVDRRLGPDFMKLAGTLSRGLILASPGVVRSRQLTGSPGPAVSAFECTVPAWSIDCAAFVVEVFVEALRSTIGPGQGATISVFSLT